MLSAPSSAQNSGYDSLSIISDDDVMYAAHFDFDLIATSSSEEESLKDKTNPDANNLSVVADVADGTRQWWQWNGLNPEAAKFGSNVAIPTPDVPRAGMQETSELMRCSSRPSGLSMLLDVSELCTAAQDMRLGA
ncbi:uncharacterized protein LOC142787112 isoform X2 [Rhipicephalus microplus]|uniref:uncharacterized protein LOC142787112 isoform X2 n=1 Tax=Rhipicephalus microplus TaxID=6941 RepID=UPI003F6BDFEA